ncbi:hypothetical protein HZB88_00530 [archaeon]|nr:hypothetical protein [archaeon]
MLNIKKESIIYWGLFLLLFTAPYCSLRQTAKPDEARKIIMQKYSNSYSKGERIQCFESDGVRYVFVDEGEYGKYVPEHEYNTLKAQVTNWINKFSKEPEPDKESIDTFLIKQDK